VTQVLYYLNQLVVETYYIKLLVFLGHHLIAGR